MVHHAGVNYNQFSLLGFLTSRCMPVSTSGVHFTGHAKYIGHKDGAYFMVPRLLVAHGQMLERDP